MSPLGKRPPSRGVIRCVCIAASGGSCEDVQVSLDGLRRGCQDIGSQGVALVSHGGTLLNTTNCDVLLPKKVFSKEPTFTYSDAAKDSQYTAVIIQAYQGDGERNVTGAAAADAKLIYIKTNIPGTDLRQGSPSAGEQILSYSGPDPLPGKFLRHTYLVLRQRQLDIAVERPRQSPVNFASWIEHNKHFCHPPVGVQYRTLYRV